MTGPNGLLFSLTMVCAVRPVCPCAPSRSLIGSLPIGSFATPWKVKRWMSTEEVCQRHQRGGNECSRVGGGRRHYLDPRYNWRNSGWQCVWLVLIAALAVDEARTGATGGACATLATGELEASASFRRRTVRAVAAMCRQRRKAPADRSVSC